MSLTCKMLNDMSDWTEFTNIELSKRYWWRFSARIYMLRKYWVRFEKTKLQWYKESFKIIYIPKTLIYKGRNSIKLIKSVSWFESVCKRLWV